MGGSHTIVPAQHKISLLPLDGPQNRSSFSAANKTSAGAGDPFVVVISVGAPWHQEVLFIRVVCVYPNNTILTQPGLANLLSGKKPLSQPLPQFIGIDA